LVNTVKGNGVGIQDGMKRLRHATSSGLCSWIEIPCEGINSSRGQILGPIQTKVLRIFLLYSFALRFIFLQTHATSYSFCKGERRKT
jgi:hypothetical protein